MAATVESQIVVYIKAILQGLPEVKLFSQTLRQMQQTANRKPLGSITSDARNAGASFKALNAAMAPLVGIGRLFTGIFHQIARQIQFAAAAAALFVASLPAIGFGLFIKEGLEFNSIMEQQKIGLAALIQSTHTLFNASAPNKPLEGIEAYNAATKIAEAATQRLRIKIIPLKATSEELLPIFNQIVTAGSAAGLGLEQLEDTFVSLTSAAQILNIPTQRLGTEIRLLLSGTTRETSRLGPALFGTAAAAREFVKQHRAAGDLFPALQEKLVAYNAALGASEQSYATLKENTVEVFQLLAGYATSGLFEKIKQGLSKITQAFFDLKAGKLKPEFESLFGFIQSALSKLGDQFVSVVEKAIGWLGAIAKYVQDNQEYVGQIVTDVVNIGIEIGRILVELGMVVGDLDHARSVSASWDDVLKFIITRIGGIHDGVNVVIGAFQYLSGVIYAGILAPLQITLEVLGMISTRAAEAAASIKAQRESAKDFANAGGRRFLSGINEEGFNSAARRANAGSLFDQKDAIRRGIDDAERKQILAKLNTRPSAGGGGGHSGGSRADNKLADALRELRDSVLDKRLAQFEARVKRVLFLFETAKQTLDRQMANHLVSITDYYDKVLAIEQNSLDAQAVEEAARRDRDRQAANSKIQALEDKARAAKNPKEREAFLTQVQAERNKLAAKEVEYSQKLDEIAGKRKAKEFEIANDRDHALAALEQETRATQASLLESRGRTEDAERLRIAGQFKSQIEKTLINFDSDRGQPIRDLIATIEELGGVGSEQFARLANDGGAAFESLSRETRDLIELMRRLETAAKLAAIQSRFDRSNRETSLEIARLQDQLNHGKLTQLEYERAINEINQRDLQIQEDLLAQAFLLADTEEEKLRIKEQLQQLKESRQVVDSFAADVNGNLRGAFNGFVDDVLEGNDDILTSFKKMLSSMLINISRLIIQTYILGALFKALGISGIGGPGGFLSGLFGKGGVGGAGAVAAGGIGLAEGGFVSGPGTSTSDSIPAMLSNDEAVLPASSVRKYGRPMIASIINGSFLPSLKFARGGFVDGSQVREAVAAPVTVKVVNAIDPNEVINQLANSNAVETLANVFSSNQSKFKSALGIA